LVRRILPWVPPVLISLLYIVGYAYYYAFLRPVIGTVALDVTVVVIWMLGMSSFVRLVVFTRLPGSMSDFLLSKSRQELRWQHVLVDNETGKITPFTDSKDIDQAESNMAFGVTPMRSRAVLWTCTTINKGVKSSRKVESPRSSPSPNALNERSDDGRFSSQSSSAANDGTHGSLIFTSHDMDSDDAPRMCKQCNAPKLDRSCHSSGYGKCLLKFDHNCIFLNTPVGHANYKYFVIFLFYTLIISSMATIATAITPQAPYCIAIVLFMSGISSLVLALLAQHIRQIHAGATTMEEIKYDAKIEAYDYGWKLNFQSVFGRFKYWFMWPFPINSTPGLGICWPEKEDLEPYWDWCEAQQRRTWYGTKNTSNANARLVLAM
jgi:hypothetical protein